MTDSDKDIVIQIISDGLDAAGADPNSKRTIIDIVQDDPLFQSTFAVKNKNVSVNDPVSGLFDLEKQLYELGEAALQGMDAKLESTRATAIERPTVSMNWGFFNDLTDTIREERKLTQFLGVGLRGVLPYAKQEASYLIDAQRREDCEKGYQEGQLAKRAVVRAQAALNRLETTELKIIDIPNDTFDDDFQVIFDDGED